MTVPKAVVFDLGKVLVDFDYRIAARCLESRCAVARDKILETIYPSPLLARFETGWISPEQFFHEVAAAIGYRGTFADFKVLFGDIFTPIGPMVELHSQLRARGLPTFIFSNTNDLAVQFIRQRFPFFSGFNGYVYSYAHHAQKPDARLYAVLEQTSGQSGPDLLYIDDRPENVAAGARRGWQVIRHESPATTIAAVKNAGLIRPPHPARLPHPSRARANAHPAGHPPGNQNRR